MTRTARTLVAAAVLVLAALGAIAVAGSIPAPTAAAVPAVAELHRIDAIPADQPAAAAEVLADVDATFMAVLLGPDTGYTPEQAADLTAAAHRVCEGVTARVPLVEMADTLVATHGFTVAEADAFVSAAMVVYCPNPGAPAV